MIKKFIPDLIVDSIYNIDLKALQTTGIKGIITDLDNTLVGAKDPLATPQLLDWLILIRSMGFKVIIVSNNDRLRVSTFAEPLSVPYIHRAKKPTRLAFRQALTTLQLPANEVVVIGDQLLTDILGGNRMGLYTILVTPISLIDEGLMTKFNRRIERRIRASVNKRNALEDTR